MQSFFVYVLQNLEGRLYVGQTENLTRRLVEHESGMGRWTANRGPWKLVLSESYETRAEATKRERALKSGRANQELRALLTQDQRIR